MFKSFLTRCIINDHHVNGISISLLIGFNFSLFFVGFFFFSLFFISFFLCLFFSFFLISFLFRFFISLFSRCFLSLSLRFIFIGFSVTFSNNLTISISGKLIVANTFLTITYQETIVIKDITRAILIRLKACYGISFNNTTQPVQTFIIKQSSIS